MKILVVLSRFPFPLEKGDKLRAYHQLKYLHQHHEVILCCLSDRTVSQKDLSEVQSICTELHVFKLSKVKQIFRLAYSLFSSKPFQVHYFYQSAIKRKIHQIIEASNPDHIYAQLIRTSEYVKNFHDAHKTLDYMDALNKNYSRRLEGSKGIKKMLIKEEAKRLVAYENLIFDYFEKHTIISEQDKQLIYHQERNKIAVIPNGVDFDFFSLEQMSTEKTIDILFTGNMGYLPNEDAALFLIKSIMPLVWKKQPNINITIAGSNPSSELKNLASDKVTITGWVDDIREIFAKAKVYIAPMRQGTGLQNKLLEAMSMKLPCITTKLANNALGAKPEEELHVYKDENHLIDLIFQLLDNEEERHTLGIKAQEFIHKNYSWDSANKKLEALINS